MIVSINQHVHIFLEFLAYSKNMRLMYLQVKHSVGRIMIEAITQDYSPSIDLAFVLRKRCNAARPTSPEKFVDDVY